VPGTGPTRKGGGGWGLLVDESREEGGRGKGSARVATSKSLCCFSSETTGKHAWSGGPRGGKLGIKRRKTNPRVDERGKREKEHKLQLSR